MIKNLDFLQSKNQIVIKFGDACNGCCLYCSQGSSHSSENICRYVSEDLISWLVNWSNLFDRKRSQNNIGEIIFYGGEPLIYFDSVKRCIADLLIKGVNPGINFWISTNGLLLTDDIVDFINEYNIEVGLSYDGRNTLLTRRKIITDKQEKLFLKIKRRNVLSVVNAFDWDFVDNKLYLENKFPDTPILANLITANHTMPEELYHFNWAKIEYSINKIISYYWFHPVDWSFKHLVWLYIKSRPDISKFWLSGYSGCSSGATKLSVDVNGNFLFCNNSSDKICTIYDGESKIIESYKKALEPKLRRCMVCEYGEYCRCHCPLSDELGDEYIYCGYLKKYISLLLKHKREFEAIYDKWSCNI